MTFDQKMRFFTEGKKIEKKIFFKKKFFFVKIFMKKSQKVDTIDRKI